MLFFSVLAASVTPLTMLLKGMRNYSFKNNNENQTLKGCQMFDFFVVL